MALATSLELGTLLNALVDEAKNLVKLLLRHLPVPQALELSFFNF